MCRKAILEKKDELGNSFLPCVNVTEAYHSCVTQDKIGKLSDLDEKSKDYFRIFSKCFFGEFQNLDLCRKHYDDILRHYFRKEDSPLKDLV